ncbi:MAG: 3'-5' exoribonuclease [Patescibacteria group bacterium]
MIILDIEASGPNCWKNGILSIGALDFNDSSREFYEECRLREGAHIDDEGLAVNGFTRKDIADPKKKTEKEIVQSFFGWCMQSKEHTIGGHNPFFDVLFLQFACEVHKLNFPLAHRMVDLHSICFYHMIKKGIEPPTNKGRSALTSDTVMSYVGISPEPKPHNAFRGAKWEAEAFMRLLHDKSLYPEFKSMKIPWKI